MAEKNLSEKKIDELELVDNSGGNIGVYKVEVTSMVVMPNKNRTCWVKGLFDDKGRLIGTKTLDGKLEISENYKSILKAEGVDLDSKKLIIDDSKIIEDEKAEREDKENTNKVQMQQNELHAREQENNNKPMEEDKQNKVAPVKKEEPDKKKKSVSIPINSADLKEHGYNVSAWTRIKDQTVIDSMIPGDADPRTVIVAEVDGKFKFLAKKFGGNEIIELPERPGGTKSLEEVNSFEDGVEKTKGKMETMVLPDYGNQEFSIRKSETGQIELYRIGDLDKDGKREELRVQTDVTHPTIEEKNRIEYEQKGFEFDDAIMTGQEIEARLAEEDESIRDEVAKQLDETDAQITSEDLDELIDKAKEEIEQQKEEEEEEREEDEYNGDWLPGMSSRRRRRR